MSDEPSEPALMSEEAAEAAPASAEEHVAAIKVQSVARGRAARATAAEEAAWAEELRQEAEHSRQAVHAQMAIDMEAEAMVAEVEAAAAETGVLPEEAAPPAASNAAGGESDGGEAPPGLRVVISAHDSRDGGTTPPSASLSLVLADNAADGDAEWAAELAAEAAHVQAQLRAEAAMKMELQSSILPPATPATTTSRHTQLSSAGRKRQGSAGVPSPVRRRAVTFERASLMPPGISLPVSLCDVRKESNGRLHQVSSGSFARSASAGAIGARAAIGGGGLPSSESAATLQRVGLTGTCALQAQARLKHTGLSLAAIAALEAALAPSPPSPPLPPSPPSPPSQPSPP